MKDLTELPLESKIGDSQTADGSYQFRHPWIKDYWLFCMVSTKDGWELVRITLKKMADKKTNRVVGVDRSLTREECCIVKDLFWNPEECVVDFIGPMTHYVGNIVHSTFLWRPVDNPLPVPNLVFAPLKAHQEAQVLTAQQPLPPADEKEA